VDKIDGLDRIYAAIKNMAGNGMSTGGACHVLPV